MGGSKSAPILAHRWLTQCKTVIYNVRMIERVLAVETSYVVFRLPRWHRNLRKRVVKAAWELVSGETQDGDRE
jgi:hypothetical protein